MKRLLVAALVMGALPALADDRLAFFQKVGIIKRAAAICDDRDLDLASVNILNSTQVQTLTAADIPASTAIAVGVMSFDRRVEEQGKEFNCALVKALAQKDGYLP